MSSRVYESRPLTVSESNGADWIVDENIRRGRLDVARRIAESAAATGSSRGLRTRARLTERHGDLAEARRLYAEIDEGYESTAVAEFALRRRARDEKVAPKDLLGELKALNRATSTQYGGVLIDDAWLSSTDAVLRVEVQKMGLRMGDMVTRVNGYEIANGLQFQTVMSFSDEPVVELGVVGDAGRGLERVLRGSLTRELYDPISRKP